MKKTILFLSIVLVPFFSRADNTVQIDWSYNQLGTPLTIYSFDGTTPLAGSAGSFVVQFGYYSAGTGSSPFAGTWVPLFGAGSDNPTATLNGSGSVSSVMGGGVTTTSGTDDRFNLNTTVDTSIASTSTGIPSAGQVMAIRYYNAASVGAATYFGAASDSSWTWVAPTTPAPAEQFYSLNDTGIVYQGGVSQPETNVSFSSVPEPSSLAFIASALGVGAVFLRRRR